MIVKKIPCFQAFPNISEVSDQCLSHLKKSYDCPCFYDIETTGLSPSHSIVYLIGAAYPTENGWALYQWFAQSPDEESEILKEFSKFLAACDCTIQYNGDHFDQPYLEKRYDVHNLASPFADMPSLDLYRILKPLKVLLKLPDMKQPQLEAFLGNTQRKYADGKACIQCYRRYLKASAEELCEEMLGHNLEDLLGLGNIFSITRYLCFYEDRYELESSQLSDDKAIFVLSLPEFLPVPFSFTDGYLYITAENKRAAVSVPRIQNRVRNYFPNPRDYVYLPDEDTVIPKALATGIDKNKRKPATPQTCYTWITCTDTFPGDKILQEQFLKKNLKIRLGFLCTK